MGRPQPNRGRPMPFYVERGTAFPFCRPRGPIVRFGRSVLGLVALSCSVRCRHPSDERQGGQWAVIGTGHYPSEGRTDRQDGL